MKTAIYKQPKLATKKVWVGSYGGHYDVVVVFKSKPKLSAKTYGYEWYDERFYDLYDNKKLIIGALFLGDWEELYGLECISEILDSENGNRSFEIEVSKVVQINLQASFDKYGDLENYNTHADGY